jgi:hypothetical protein
LKIFVQNAKPTDKTEKKIYLTLIESLNENIESLLNIVEESVEIFFLNKSMVSKALKS